MKQPRYRFLGRLETGELAELYEAVRDERDRVVVKLFHARTSDPRYARALAEATRRLSDVPGDGHLRTLDVGMARDRLAVVREQVPGHTLGQALQRLSTRDVILPHALALHVVIGLADAVQAAHEAGVVHGAITPGNVLLSTDGRTALGDFGALAALRAVPDLKAFLVKGRSAYRAPELSQGAEPSPASDLYSLGAIAYELLTLREPARDEKQVSTRHIPLPPPSRLDRRINARLDPIVLRALDHSASRRFRSAGELSNALRNYLGASGGMPSRGELARFVGELFPPEAMPQPSSTVPFAESFVLDAVDGAHVPLVETEERSAILSARPSFSDGFIPAVLPDDPSQEETQQAHSPPISPSQEWEAPPGLAPVAPSVLNLGSPGTIRGRVRVVDDFAVPLTEASATAEPEPSPPASSHPAARTELSIAVPSISGENELPPAPMVTSERVLWQAALRRRRFGALALAVALVGLFAFGLAIWRKGRRPSSPALVESLPPKPTAPVAEAPPPASARPEPRKVKPPVETVAEPTYVAPAQKGAWLRVTSNLPATVYVDGVRAGTTPIRSLKVAPGKRRIAVQAVDTGERREFSKYFRSGQKVQIAERFDAAPKR